MPTLLARCLGVVGLLCVSVVAQAAVETRQTAGGIHLSNGAIELTVSPAGVISASVARGGKSVPILSDARVDIELEGKKSKGPQLSGAPTATIIDLKSELGAGKAVELTYGIPGGKVRAVLGMYDHGEFFTSELFVAATDQSIAVRAAEVLRGQLDLGPGELRVLRNDAMWMTTVRVLGKGRESRFSSTVYNRQSRQGAILGALTADAASTIFTEHQGPAAEFNMSVSYDGPGRVQKVAPGTTLNTGAFIVLLPGHIFEGLESYGAAVRKYNNIKLYRPIPCGWCSWDCLGWDMKEQQLYETIEAIRAMRLPEYGFNVMQIDDGWQRGWRCSGDWQFNVKRFPHGIKPIAEKANALGVTLGLWIGPFSDEDANSSAGPSGEVKPGGPGWMDHARPILDNFPEFKSEKDGKRGNGYDLSLPEFQKHLTDDLRRLTNDYGAGYIKADFLAYGYANSDKNTPSHVVYRNALKAMRAGMGANTYLMTCISHEWKSLGIANAQRIGNDVQWNWKGLYPTARCAGGWYFCNGNFWWNDPDQLHIAGGVDKTGKHRGLTFPQAQAWATLVALHGGVTITGDRLNPNQMERMKLFMQCMPSTGRTARPLDLFDVLTEASPEIFSGIWALNVPKPFGNYHLLGVFNWATDGAQERKINLTEVGCGPQDSLLVYDFWNGKLLPSQKGDSILAVSVPPTSVRLLVLHKGTGGPQFLASDRHIVTGDVDLAEIQAQGDTLSGKSQALVSGVPFCYTFYVPQGKKVIEAVFDGKPANVEMRDAQLAAITFTPSQAKISWSIRVGGK